MPQSVHQLMKQVKFTWKRISASQITGTFTCPVTGDKMSFPGGTKKVIKDRTLVHLAQVARTAAVVQS